MKVHLHLLAVTAMFLLVACGGQQGPAAGPWVAPGIKANGNAAHSTGQLILLGGTKPDASCPSQYVYCVTLSKGKPVQLYFCYSPGSYCGPSQYQYDWIGYFYVVKSGNPTFDFAGSFSPNPGDPTYDTISEAKRVKSTHGRYKYEQRICTANSETCQATFLVGIAVK